MKNKILALIAGAIVIANSQAGGYSWYRHIYNTSQTNLGVMVENSVKGNYYITCNGVTYKNPSSLIIAPGQTCETKSTTTDAYHSTYLVFYLPNISPNHGHKFNLRGSFASSNSTIFGFTCEESYLKSAYFDKIIDAGSLVLNGYPKGNKPNGSSNQLQNYPFKICPWYIYERNTDGVRPADGDIWLYSNEPIKGGYGYTVPLISVSRQSTIIYNYVPYPISFDGLVEKGSIKITYGDSYAEPEGGELQFTPSDTTIDLDHKLKAFKVDRAQTDEKGNLVPGTITVDYKYNPDTDKSLMGAYHVYNQETGKVVDLGIENFWISNISAGGGKFDYWVESPDGVMHKVRILLNVAPYEEGTIAQSPGGMIICPVGYPGINECK